MCLAAFMSLNKLIDDWLFNAAISHIWVSWVSTDIVMAWTILDCCYGKKKHYLQTSELCKPVNISVIMSHSVRLNRCSWCLHVVVFLTRCCDFVQNCVKRLLLTTVCLSASVCELWDVFDRFLHRTFVCQPCSFTVNTSLPTVVALAIDNV